MQERLTEIDWTFKDKEARPGRHGLHSYPATMHSACVSSFLDIIKPQGFVLDPFGGSGTVALEAVKQGLPVYTNDLNPLARIICEAKLLVYHSGFKDDAEQFINLISNEAKKATPLVEWAKNLFAIGESIEKDVLKRDLLEQQQKELDNNLYSKFDKASVSYPKFKNIAYWFKPEVIIALQLLKKNLPLHPFYKLCFSEVVRIVSNRRSGEFKLFRRPAEELTKYSPDVFSIFIKIINRNLRLIESDIYPATEFHITNDDARSLQTIPDNSISFVITSPPYGDSRTTVAYGQFSRLSLQWLDIPDTNQIDNNLLGGSSERTKFQLFKTLDTVLSSIAKKDERRAKDVAVFFADLHESFLAIDRKCLNECYQVWIVGNRMVKGIRTPLDAFLVEVGEQSGYTCVATLPRKIPYKAMPRLNSPSNESGVTLETMSEESIVVLRKA